MKTPSIRINFHHNISIFVPVNAEIKTGFLGAMIMAAWLTIQYFLGWYESEKITAASWLNLILLASFIFIAVLGKRRNAEESLLSFKNAFSAGLVCTFIISIAVGTFKLVHVKYVNPAFAEWMVTETITRYEKLNSSQQQVSDAAETVRAMYSPFGQFTYGIGTTMLTGTVFSLLTALLLQKKTPKPS